MTEIRLTDRSEEHTAVLREQVPMAQLPEFFHRAFAAAMAQVQAQGVQVTGPPFGKYYGIPGESVDVEAGFPVSGPIATADGVAAGMLPGGPAVEAVHVGPYDTLAATYGEVESWIDERGLRTIEVMWESYLSDPGEHPDPATWQTLICIPLAAGQGG